VSADQRERTPVRVRVTGSTPLMTMIANTAAAVSSPMPRLVYRRRSLSWPSLVLTSPIIGPFSQPALDLLVRRRCAWLSSPGTRCRRSRRSRSRRPRLGARCSRGIVSAQRGTRRW
jgi:hypothetical protein